jgi:hypothetical protein
VTAQDGATLFCLFRKQQTVDEETLQLLCKAGKDDVVIKR